MRRRCRRCERALAGTGIAVAAGTQALEEAAAEPVDIVLSAIVGAAGLPPTAAAIRSGNHIALANKECLICAGSALMALAKKHQVRVLPVDSEHNALYQLLDDRDPAHIRPTRLLLPEDRSAPGRRSVLRAPPRRRRSLIRPGPWAPRSPSIRQRS
jgi:1-deoxy-D-xylulose 5-phosphate reductoisomerase